MCNKNSRKNLRNASSRSTNSDGMHVSMETVKKCHIRSAFTTSYDTQRHRSCLLVIREKMYLVIRIDDSLHFNPKQHVLNLVGTLRLKLGFYFGDKSCFSLNGKKTHPVASTFSFTCVGLWGSSVRACLCSVSPYD